MQLLKIHYHRGLRFPYNNQNFLIKIKHPTPTQSIFLNLTCILPNLSLSRVIQTIFPGLNLSSLTIFGVMRLLTTPMVSRCSMQLVYSQELQNSGYSRTSILILRLTTICPGYLPNFRTFLRGLPLSNIGSEICVHLNSRNQSVIWPFLSRPSPIHSPPAGLIILSFLYSQRS